MYCTPPELMAAMEGGRAWRREGAESAKANREMSCMQAGINSRAAVDLVAITALAAEPVELVASISQRAAEILFLVPPALEVLMPRCVEAPAGRFVQALEPLCVEAGVPRNVGGAGADRRADADRRGGAGATLRGVAGAAQRGGARAAQHGNAARAVAI